MRNCNVLIQATKFLVFSILVTQNAWASPAPRTSEPQEITVKITTTQSAYVVTRLLDENLPTLILMPGIFRGFLKNEEILNVLSRRKLNWVAWHSSRHPESLLIDGQNPWAHPITSQDLAQELVILKRSLKIKNPILVSLSYSASIVPYISAKEFPVVFETAPMGTSMENNPPSPYYESWRQWMGMFPIFGNMVVQTQEYWAYRGFWYQQTMGLVNTHPRYKEKQTLIAEGLAQLAYAGRDFDLRKQDFSKGPKRFWILGQNENPVRKNIQQEAISLYESQTGHKASFYEVKDAGHVIPNENPVMYVKLLSELVQKLSQ